MDFKRRMDTVEKLTDVYWETIFLRLCEQRLWQPFFQTLFQGDLYSEQPLEILSLPWEEEGVSTVQYNEDNTLGQGKSWVGLLELLKDSGTLNFEVHQLWCRPTVCSGVHLGHSPLPQWDLGRKGNWQEHKAHAACCIYC